MNTVCRGQCGRRTAKLGISVCWALVAVPSVVGAQPTPLPDGEARVVSVDGIATRVLTRGLGDRAAHQPIIFLQAGGGSAIEDWGEWIDSVSGLGPIVAYDRPGIGESEAMPSDPDPESVTNHARALLAAVGAAPPYVLVGHSWGGPLILHYAGRYPEEVVGLVYLDATEPRLSRSQLLQASNEVDLERREAEYAEALAEVLPGVPEGMAAEARAMDAFLLAPIPERGLPDEDPRIPTAVVIATSPPPIFPGSPPFMDAAYHARSMHDRLIRAAERVSGRPNTTLIVATDAGHFVHLEAPGLSTAAVRRVLAQIAAEQPDGDGGS